MPETFPTFLRDVFYLMRINPEAKLKEMPEINRPSFYMASTGSFTELHYEDHMAASLNEIIKGGALLHGPLLADHSPSQENNRKTSARGETYLIVAQSCAAPNIRSPNPDESEDKKEENKL